MDNEKLFLDNVYLVDLLINKLYYNNYLRDDLRQVALMGLFKASLKYNESFGVKFSTYATYFVLGEIKRELRENKLIRTGKKVTKIISLLRENKTLKEIKEETKYSDEYIYTALMYKENIKTFSISDIDIEEENKNDRLLTDIEIILKGDLYKVIKYRYFMNLNQKEISEIMNISQATCSRLEARALKILRENYFK